MQKLIVLGLMIASAVSAQDINVCRQGQSIVIPIQSLSPYDEIGGCGANYFFIPPSAGPAPTAAPATAMPMAASVATPTAASAAMPTAASASMPIPSSMPFISDISASTPTVIIDPAAVNEAATLMTPAGSEMPIMLGMGSLLPPSAIVPGNGVMPSSIAQPTDVAAAPAAMMPSTTVGALPPNDMPVAGSSGMPQMQPSPSVATSIASHVDGQHEWQATGSFSHGHMQSVVKANHALPANMDPNDPKTRVFVFLQWFSQDSVYEHPQQVFMFFKKPADLSGQRTMRIN